MCFSPSSAFEAALSDGDSLAAVLLSGKVIVLLVEDIFLLEYAILWYYSIMEIKLVRKRELDIDGK